MFKSTLIFSLIHSLITVTQPLFDKEQLLSHNFNNKNYLVTSNKTFYQKNTTNKNRDTKLEVEGFIFELIRCKASGYNVTRCELAVENKREKRTLQIVVNKTRIIDDAGNEIIASQATLGSRNGRYGVINDLTTNVPVRASITFNGLIGEKINLLDISFYMQGTGYFNAEFKRK